MEQNELLTKLKSIITPYAQDPAALENISGESDFFNDLKINSANLVDIILDIESEFDIQIENEAVEKMVTVGAAIDIISEKINLN